MAAPATNARTRRTRERLIEAGGAVFAAQGYRGATMREIAERAGANLAAAHYHFGSKQDLYREVARSYFERLEARLAESGSAGAGRVRSRAAAAAALRARVRTMLEVLLEEDDVHAQLMLREFADPSEVLPEIVRRWIDPLRRDMEQLLGQLAPGLDEAGVARAGRSVVGQVFFYRTHRAALLLMMGRRAYPPGFADEVAEHVVAFTKGGLAVLERKRSRRARSAPARRRS